MNEKLLQFIWQFQYFNRTELLAENGGPLQIISPGQFNTNQGPDFKEAKIKIGTTTWAGNVELHTRSSDWQKHNHHADKNYNNVILHVVWENDADLTEINIPTLVLQHRVSKWLLDKYEDWMNSQSFIPCEKNISSVSSLIWVTWKERLLIERLQRKIIIIEKYLQQNKQHWEETFWWLLARNFGFKVNADAFEAMAQSIPLNILAKHKYQVHQLEAMLLGQTNLLANNFTEDYPQLLQKEYSFLQKKYKLQPIQQPVYFLRMRPGNFPTIRLAQLAILIHQSLHLFSVIKEKESVKDFRELFQVTANDYWHYHYLFDETSSFKQKTLGKQMVDNIIINTVVPVLFAYGHLHKEQAYKDKALHLLEQLDAEKNAITDGWKNNNIACQTAFDSQALIELKTQYCDSRRCLECAVGNALLRNMK
ncbi:MAG: DUF2851 family protein [Bacteroidetes bacterium]|nr:DUF2851 family protein [Bacteroidota bacterium]